MSDEAERTWRDCIDTLGARGQSLHGAFESLLRRARSGHDFEVERLAFATTLVAALTQRAARDDGKNALDPGDLAIEDLYLAAGVLEGETTAIAAARARFDPILRRVIDRLVPTAEQEDTRQRLETHLLVARGAQGPALASYRGSGSLDSWVRAVSTRFVVDDTRARARAPVQAAWRSQSDDVAPSEIERRVAVHEHGQAVRDAMTRAFAELTVRERNLIRYSVFHGLGVDNLGALYGVHRSTAARWLERARTSLSAHVEAEFTRQLGAAEGEAASLLRDVRGRLDVSVRSFLASTLEAEPRAE